MEVVHKMKLNDEGFKFDSQIDELGDTEFKGVESIGKMVIDLEKEDSSIMYSNISSRIHEEVKRLNNEVVVKVITKILGREPGMVDINRFESHVDILDISKYFFKWDGEVVGVVETLVNEGKISVVFTPNEK